MDSTECQGPYNRMESDGGCLTLRKVQRTWTDADGETAAAEKVMSIKRGRIDPHAARNAAL